MEEESLSYITNIEISRGHLDLNLLKKSIPDCAPWWMQLEHNAQEGVVSRRFYDERTNAFVEWSGTMKQKDNGTWRWEKYDNEVRGQSLICIADAGSSYTLIGQQDDKSEDAGDKEVVANMNRKSFCYCVGRGWRSHHVGTLYAFMWFAIGTFGTSGRAIDDPA